MFVLLWLKRFFLSHHRFIRWTPFVSIFSLTLAVATLVLALSVYSGYETTIRQAVMDMTGHLMITTEKPLSRKTLYQKIQSCCLVDEDYFSFLSMPALAIYDGKLSGILLEGWPPAKENKVLNLNKRLVEGLFHLNKKKSAIIGRSLARKWNIKPGDVFHVVLPKKNPRGEFHKIYKELTVEGIVDLGFHDFNSRYIITHIQSLESIIQGPEQGVPNHNFGPGRHQKTWSPKTYVSKLVSGIRLRLKNPDNIQSLRASLIQKLGPAYKVQDWEDILKNTHAGYFQAVKREKFLIFFILMVLILAGAFNVSSHLTISFLNQARAISILKAMGARNGFIFFILMVQGFIVSLTGALIGIGLGWVLTLCFTAIQNIWPLIPAEIYKVNMIKLSLKTGDILLIIVCSQVICLVSCVFPAIRALKMSIRENLLSE